MGSLWNREPVLFMTVIQAGLALLLSFGIHLSVEQIGAILAFSAAVIGFVVRSQVVPTGNAPPPSVTMGAKLMLILALLVLPLEVASVAWIWTV